MPSYAEEKGLKKQTTKKITNEKYKIKEQEKEIKKLKKELYEEKTKVDILSWVYAKKHTQRIIVFEHPLILRRILYL
jgi:predicted RNase H-like nuclease (RuvC/YqgF family)